MIAFFFFVVEAAVSDDSSVAVSSGIQASSLSSWIIIESEYSTLRGAGMNAPSGWLWLRFSRPVDGFDRQAGLGWG